MIRSRDTSVKRYRGRSVDHCGDPLLPPPLDGGDCLGCRHLQTRLERAVNWIKDERTARFALEAEVAALHALINTAAQMAIDEGPEIDCE